ncbi:MAG: DUF1800 family protein [Verrucomicrobiaceae bacterium]|nr:DUF1800 family protein [Verrucomicrobiaceae bacterium]
MVKKLSTVVFLVSATAASALDANSNQQSDIWEIFYSAQGLPSSADNDSDGWSNFTEAVAGTNPLNPDSRPAVSMTGGGTGTVSLSWLSQLGKSYAILGSETLSGFVPLRSVPGVGGLQDEVVSTTGLTRYFFKIQASDVDSDLDGLNDWEEYALGFDPSLIRTDRNDSANDLTRVQSNLYAASTVTIGLVDGDMREDWPDKGIVAIRRTGGMLPLTINLSFSGSASRGVDYTDNAISSQIVLPLGARETWVQISPVADVSAEGDELVNVSISAGTGYTVGALAGTTLRLSDSSPLPSAKEAARFLIQAAFGPDQDGVDADAIPENVEEIMSMGLEEWIDEQFTRPVGYIQPYVDWATQYANALQLFGNYKQHSWWARAMGVAKLRPDAVDTQLPDPLRQRVAFALSEILVTSDRPETLAVDQAGMANYYDIFERHAFGNYLDILKEVAMHPVMGVYLSHLGNQKANPALNIHPDENFAREIMQLFSIGLWELENDGRRKTYSVGHPAAGQFIPTYSNADITELARVFTGLTWADSPGFNPNNLINGDRQQPMKIWDAYHDCDPKTLLGGLQLPARTPSSGNTGTAGTLDINEAVTNLFNHANVGPFIGRLLIQRFVTSNPSHDYIGRVASKFNDNGIGVRGDMKAVIKQILLDPEARDPAFMESPTFGKLREPFLRVVNLARAFNAASTSGHYPLDQFVLDHLQDPQNSPSVFNFFLPSHSPPGVVTQLGLVAPEFQIVNASSAITGANYFYSAIGDNSLHRWGNGTPAYVVRLNLDPELSMVVPAANMSEDSPSSSLLMDSDALIRRLDLCLLGGTMSPRLFQTIRESIDRVRPPNTSWRWHRERLRLLITLIVTSAEFNVLR